MHVDLPSGHQAELRDTLSHADIKSARKGIVVVIAADGSQRIEGDLSDIMTERLLVSLITSWNLPGMPMRPGDASNPELAAAMLGKLDSADYAALEDEVQPWIRQINRTKGIVFAHIDSGIEVLAATKADEALLRQHPEFALVVRDDDPKSGQTRSLPSSSAVVPGQVEPDSSPPTLT